VKVTMTLHVGPAHLFKMKDVNIYFQRINVKDVALHITKYSVLKVYDIRASETLISSLGQKP